MIISRRKRGERKSHTRKRIPFVFHRREGISEFWRRDVVVQIPINWGGIMLKQRKLIFTWGKTGSHLQKKKAKGKIHGGDGKA